MVTDCGRIGKTKIAENLIVSELPSNYPVTPTGCHRGHKYTVLVVRGQQMIAIRQANQGPGRRTGVPAFRIQSTVDQCVLKPNGFVA